MPSHDRLEPRRTLAQRTKKMIRLSKVEKMLLNGVTSHSEIGAAFGVSRHTVIRWLKEIHDKWQKQRPEEIEESRNLRRVQLEHIFFKAMSSFEKSQHPVTEEVVEKMRCRNCNGEGTVEETPGSWEKCKDCDGKKFVVIKIMKKKKTSVGDPTFLRIAKEIIHELAKVDGVIAPDNAKFISTKLMQSADDVTGALRDEIHQLYIEAPEDTIIKAMLAFEELDRASKPKVKSSLPDGKAAKMIVVEEDKNEDKPQNQEDVK